MANVLRSSLKLGLVRAGLGAGPKVIIVGAQKAGTTGLYRTLAQHPEIITGKRKELHYFDDGFIQYGDHAQYERCFPLRWHHGDKLALEASPEYLVHPQAAQRVKSYNSHMKIIALVREPISRAYSAWNMYHNKFPTMQEAYAGPLVDNRSFEEAVCSEIEHWDSWSWERDPYAYLRRGVYVEQLDRWAKEFPLSQMLVIDQSELLAMPAQTTKRVTDFLGIAEINDLPQVKGNVSRYDASISAETEAKLKAFFAPHNKALFNNYGLGGAWL